MIHAKIMMFSTLVSIQLAFVAMTSISVAAMQLDHEIGFQEHTPIKAYSHGLEESSTRAELITKHGNGREDLTEFKPIDNLVSRYLTGPELPRDTEQVSNLLGEFSQIFKNMKVQSWEGEYSIELFQHILHFWSYGSSNSPLLQALKDRTLWKNLHQSLAQNDIIQLSERLRPFLSQKKLSSSPEVDLYSILNNPQQNHPHFEVAIKELLVELKDIADKDLKDAYSLVMAHDCLGHTAEKILLNEPRWNIVEGLQQAWAAVHPNFELGDVDVMDYRYHILLKNPHLLAHAKWDQLICDPWKVSKSLPQSFDKSLLDKPSVPYDVSNYNEEYYHKISTMMTGWDKDSLYPMGLFMLMHLNKYLPKGPEYLIKMLKEDHYGTTLHDATAYVKSNKLYMRTPVKTGLFPPQGFQELTDFVEALSSGIHDGLKVEGPQQIIARIKHSLKSLKQYIMHPKGEPSDLPKQGDKSGKYRKYLSSWDDGAWDSNLQQRKLARMQIGKAVFSLSSHSEDPWDPFNVIVLDEA
ncbi:hypothetical protein DFH28DRAFT_504378 [Melampsora americana]|nr:hypothetical protein DFH28DRAFT_504378 [Melampsora americana]